MDQLLESFDQVGFETNVCRVFGSVQNAINVQKHNRWWCWECWLGIFCDRRRFRSRFRFRRRHCLDAGWVMLALFPHRSCQTMENLPEHDSYTNYLKGGSLGEKPPKYPCLENWGCHGHRIMAGRRGMEVGRTTPLVEILYHLYVRDVLL